MTEMAQKWLKIDLKMNLFETDWNDIDLIGLTEMTKKWLTFDWYNLKWLKINEIAQKRLRWLKTDYNDIEVTGLTEMTKINLILTDITKNDLEITEMT